MPSTRQARWNTCSNHRRPPLPQLPTASGSVRPQISIAAKTQTREPSSDSKGVRCTPSRKVDRETIPVPPAFVWPRNYCDKSATSPSVTAVHWFRQAGTASNYELPVVSGKSKSPCPYLRRVGETAFRSPFAVRDTTGPAGLGTPPPTSDASRQNITVEQQGTGAIAPPPLFLQKSRNSSTYPNPIPPP